MSEQKKILVLEDERPLARALELKLSHEGFDVRMLPNGEEGLALLERESFDLILSDLVMPKVDGFAVLKAVKERGLSVPVIVLTNLSDEESVMKSLNEAAFDYLVKADWKLEDIVRKIRERLEK